MASGVETNATRAIYLGGISEWRWIGLVFAKTAMMVGFCTLIPDKVQHSFLSSDRGKSLRRANSPLANKLNPAAQSAKIVR
jgi:hypothetical protein